MNWYLQALRNYANFDGRARRSEYWYFTLFNIIFLFAAMAIDFVIGFPVLYFLYAIVSLLPGIAVSIRRLHDTSRSGWWILIALVPLIGGIVLLVYLVEDSKPGSNEYGPNPKEDPLPGDDIERHLVS